jgi:long-chain acyl-CoA synthetase
MGETIDRIFEEAAARRGKRPFLFFEGGTTRYRAFCERVSRLAGGFARAGIGPGDRVGLLLGNSPDFAAALFSLLRTGATVVPINHFLTEQEVASLLKRASVRALIAGEEFLHLVSESAAPERGLFVFGRAGRGEPLEPLQEGEPLPDAHPRPAPKSTALLLYTSGTEGEPRGVLLGPTADDRFLVFLPLFHTFTLTVCLFLPAALGASIILFRSARDFPAIMREGLLRRRATYFIGVPAVYNALARRRIPLLLRRLHSLRVMVSGSAPLSNRTVTAVQERFGAPLLEGYGLTEAGPVVSVNRPGRRIIGTVGLPLPGVAVRVVDEAGRDRMHGEVGELLVRGENVADRFLGGESPVTDGWLHTGDLASMSADGFLTIHDRKKDLILVRGMNVYPREIEEAIAEHPSVAAVAVVRARSGTKGEVPRAFIVPAEGTNPTAAAIVGHLRGLLAPYKIPVFVEFVPDLPRSGTGKVLRRVLADRPLPPIGG